MMFFGTIFFGGGMLPDEAPLLCVWLFSPMLVLCLGEVCCSCLFLAFVICDMVLGFVICVAVRNGLHRFDPRSRHFCDVV